MPALPAPPVRQTSFTDISVNTPNSQQPGNLLDTEFDRADGAIAQILLFLPISLAADGTLLPAQVLAAYNQAIASGGGSDMDEDTTANPAALSAQLAQAWAEHMPDMLPADTLANTGITGDHWSARWWANQAVLTATGVAQTLADFQDALTMQINAQNAEVQAIIAAWNATIVGQIAGGQVTIVSAVAVVPIKPFTAVNGITTQFTLLRADDGTFVTPNAPELFVSVDGVILDAGVDFTVAGNLITFAEAPKADGLPWLVWIAPGTRGDESADFNLDGGVF
jgi:hypothetical protein